LVVDREARDEAARQVAKIWLGDQDQAKKSLGLSAVDREQKIARHRAEREERQRRAQEAAAAVPPGVTPAPVEPEHKQMLAEAVAAVLAAEGADRVERLHRLREVAVAYRDDYWAGWARRQLKRTRTECPASRTTN
jgi:hypothetical protein